MALLAEDNADLAVAEVCWKHRISNALYDLWMSKYAGVPVNELKRIRELETENSWLKKMHVERAVEVMTTDHKLLKTQACRIKGLSWGDVISPREDRLKRDKPLIDVMNGIVKKHLL